MTLAYSFDKARLPRGLSFPLKRSDLDTVLLEAEVTRVHCVYYWLRQGGHIVTRADSCGEGGGATRAIRRLGITSPASPVPGGRAESNKACLMSKVLPRMVSSLKEMERSGIIRRGADQSFVATYEAGAAVIEAS